MEKTAEQYEYDYEYEIWRYGDLELGRNGVTNTLNRLAAETARLQGREKELMELLNDARGHLALNPSYPSKQVVIGKIDALLSRYSGEQKENV